MIEQEKAPQQPGSYGAGKGRKSRREKDLSEEKRSPPRADISRLLRHAADVVMAIFYPLAPGGTVKGRKRYERKSNGKEVKGKADKRDRGVGSSRHASRSRKIPPQ